MVRIVVVVLVLLSGCKKYEDFRIGDVVEYKTVDMIGTGMVINAEESIEGNYMIYYYKVETLHADENGNRDSEYFHPALLRKLCL